jgi:hypothetical protein
MDETEISVSNLGNILYVFLVENVRLFTLRSCSWVNYLVMSEYLSYTLEFKLVISNLLQ